MNCNAIRDQIVETARGRELSTDARAVIFEHAAACEDCAAWLHNEQSLSRAFGVIAHTAPTAPRRMEQLLLKHLPTPIRKRSVSKQWAAGTVLAAAAAVGFAVLPHPTLRKAAGISANPISTHFAPLKPSGIEAAPLERPTQRLPLQRVSVSSGEGEFIPLYASDAGESAAEATQVVRVQIQRESLASLGFPVAANVSGSVEADVLIGIDGTPRGIRLVE